MKTYELTCLVNSTVVIEDLGIKLSGLNSTVVISEQAYQNSRCIQQVKGSLKIRAINSAIWPFSKPNATKNKPTVLNAALRLKKDSNDFSVPVLPKAGKSWQEIEKMNTASKAVAIDPRVDVLINQVNVLVNSLNKYNEMTLNKLPEVLEKLSSSINYSHRQNINGNGNTQSYTTPSMTISEDPIFIPSKILPETQEMRVNTRQEDQDRPDLDEATITLKKLRGKSKVKK